MSPRPISQGLAATLGLRQMIIEGELVAGDRVSELGLVDRLQVSRTPLRLARLAAERHGGQADLGELIGIVARIDRVLRPGQDGVEDFDLYVELNEHFHNELFVLAASDALKDAYDRVLALPFAAPSAFIAVQEALSSWQETVTVAQNQHKELLEAIETGDGARAETIAREHARLARTNLDVALRSEESLHKLPGGTLIRLSDDEPEVAGVG